jgi:hypothetical protein
MIALRVEVGPSSPTRPQMIGANQSESDYGLLSRLASGDAP